MKVFRSSKKHMHAQHRKKVMNSVASAMHNYPKAPELLEQALRILKAELGVVIPTPSMPSLTNSKALMYSSNKWPIGSYSVPDNVVNVLKFLVYTQVADLPSGKLLATGIQSLAEGNRICPYDANGSMIGEHTINWRNLPLVLQPNENIAKASANLLSDPLVGYEQIGINLKGLIDETHQNWREHSENNQEVAEFMQGFEAFKQERASIIKANVLAEFIAAEHYNRSTDYSGFGDQYKALFTNPVLIEQQFAESRRLKTKLEKTLLIQYIAHKQQLGRNQLLATEGIQTVTDMPIAIPAIYKLLYPGAFLEGWCLGAPPEAIYAKKDEVDIGQKWDMPVLDPLKLFNKNGSLGSAGEVLQAHVRFLVQQSGGSIRVDHAISMLLSGWVYPEGSNPADPRAFRLMAAPSDHTEELARQLSVIPQADANEAFQVGGNGYDADAIHEGYLNEHPEIVQQFARVIEQIVIPTLREEAAKLNLSPKLILENLGVVPLTARKAYEYLASKFPEVVTQMTVGQHAEPTDKDHMYLPTNVQPGTTVFTSTHDSPSAWAFVNEVFDGPSEQKEAWIEYFESLFPKFDTNKLRQYKQEFLKYYKAACLLRGETNPGQGQSLTSTTMAFFPDVFGGKTLRFNGQDLRFNQPGTGTNQIGVNPNWRIRIPEGWLTGMDESYAQGLTTTPYADVALALEALIEREGQRKEPNFSLRATIATFINVDREIRRSETADAA
jgi:4-alpha-glucanotransferase